ncbi:NAD dependent deacetylase sirtuin 7 [Echinococcus multilocularis]|uniref:NAD dependent deacetylase sirtuin 7 n=1 Tax=Echinococcus multilocularis TaxID=6211 RepID=A0A068Y4Z2_ECHMU|nr:NAD dependent deacetylase sirtuin 7 [Echinococcus multilocularis]
MAIRAIHGTKSPETAASPPVVINAPIQSPTPSNPIPADGNSANEVNVDTSPVSLILVIGTSLTVLRFYTFLWPRGLRRCLSAATKCGDGGNAASPKRPRLSPNSEATTVSTATVTTTSDESMENCELAIINMQSTCKDGLASFVSRRACDDLLRETVEGCSYPSVPIYHAMRKFL